MAGEEPISRDEAKAHLNLGTFSGDDDMIDGLITDAREFVESKTGLVLVPRDITETARQLGAYIDLSSWPITSVNAIRYPGPTGLAAIPPGGWMQSFKARPVRVLPSTAGWGVGAYAFAGYACRPATLPVEIDITAGYTSPDDVPRRVKRAMLLLIGHWYGNRDAAEVGQRAAAVELPMGVTDLLRGLKDQVI